MTLSATIILAVVVFCVPYVKSVYFLKAVVNETISENIILGTLGYCLQMPGNTTCSNPSIGYKFGLYIDPPFWCPIFMSRLDINPLVGNKLPIKIPDKFVGWVTTLLVFHVIAFLGAAAAALLGLLSNVPGLTIPCLGNCFSWLTSSVTLFVFLLDIILFSVIKTGMNTAGTVAHTGNAIWLTLAAWVLLLVSSFVNCCG
jgi:hypothetical protein